MASDLDFEKHIKELTPLIKKIASNYLGNKFTMEELFQEGMLGVFEALKRFNPEKNTKFTTYATFWIKKYIMMYVENNTENYRLKNNILEQNIVGTSINKVDYDLEKFNKLPCLEKKVMQFLYIEKKTIKEIASKLNLSREKIRQTKEKALRRLRAIKK